ncbi:MAG: ABC transporter ATP-binding protein [Bacteroidia bacterium]|nr:ABC transporter ATP-binding protein [Bacteroidia bacterium]
MIHAQDIHKSFDGNEIVKGVTLHIHKGEIVTIMGSSGAGKSTLLSILGTLEKPDKGKVLIDGTDVFNLNDKALSVFRNQHIGFVFQFHYLLPELTALENVCLPARISGTSVAEAEKRAKQLLDYIGLTHRMHALPSVMSGGEQQRVAVVRALINQPKVILADEPTGNLDTENARLLHEWFGKLRNDFGQTFVIVTHNKELASVSDRTVFMKDGIITNAL